MQDITDSLIKQLKMRAAEEHGNLEISDAGCKGLRVRASYGGASAFYLLYRPRGERTMKRVLVGKYPSIGVSEARRRATALRGEIADGGDPVERKRVEKRATLERNQEAERQALALASRMTVRDLAERWLHEKRSLRWVPRYRGLLDFNLLKPSERHPELHMGMADKALADFTGDDIDRIIQAIQHRGSEVQARRFFEAIRAAVRWGAKKKLVSADILASVSIPDNAEARERFLNVEELRTVWTTLAEWDRLGSMQPDTVLPIPHAAIRVLRLQMLLATRSGELCGMRKYEMSDDGLRWTIAAERAKNGMALTLPLPRLARQIMGEVRATSQHPALMFPVHARGASADGFHPMRSDVVSKHVAEIQSAFNFLDREGAPAPWTSHDLRRTAATYLSKLGVAGPVVGAILNHKSETKGTVTSRHYNQDDMQRPMREALTRWEDALQAIAEGGDPFATDEVTVAEIEGRLLRGPGRKLVAIAGGRA